MSAWCKVEMSGSWAEATAWGAWRGLGGDERAPGAPAGEELRRGWRGGAGAQGARAAVEQPPCHGPAGEGTGAGPGTLCRFRADPGGREAGRAARLQGLARDLARL